jgi:hypothetical protein
MRPSARVSHSRLACDSYSGWPYLVRMDIPSLWLSRRQSSLRLLTRSTPVWLPKSDIGRGGTRTAGHRISCDLRFCGRMAGFEPAASWSRTSGAAGRLAVLPVRCVCRRSSLRAVARGDVAVLGCCTVYRISSSGRRCPDRFRLVQRPCSVCPGCRGTVLNCNPKLQPCHQHGNLRHPGWMLHLLPSGDRKPLVMCGHGLDGEAPLRRM